VSVIVFLESFFSCALLFFSLGFVSLEFGVGLSFASCVPLCDCYTLSLSVFKNVWDWASRSYRLGGLI